MATLMHDIVDDRVIHGNGTSVQSWMNSQSLMHCHPLQVQSYFPQGSRICIVAPHPDDEILGCAGLIQSLDQAGFEVILFAVTNGTASHPHSSIYTPDQLNRIRPLESIRALSKLNLKQTIQRIAFNIEDGEVANQQQRLEKCLKEHLTDRDVLVSTFIHDGHPDHEITGQVVQRVARELGLKNLQVLIWAWHWATPDDHRIPWHKALRLDLDIQQLQRKHHAILSFESQTSVDASTRQPPILPKHVIERIMQPWELYIDE